MAVKSITLMRPSFELTLTAVLGPAGSDQHSLIFVSWRPAMSRSHYKTRWRGQAGFNERFHLSVGAICAPIPCNWYNWLWSIGDRVARSKGRHFRLHWIQSILSLSELLYSVGLIDFGGSLCKRKSVAMIGQPWSMATNWILNRDMIDRF